MWRVQQIAFTARLVKVVSHFRSGQATLSWCQGVWPIRELYGALLGYKRPFQSLMEASASVAPYACKGHENSCNVDLHLGFSIKPRPSDYAALFYLQPIASCLHTIFDLGGNVGNLYYLYSKYLACVPHLIWHVMDLPTTLATGKEFAEQRGAAPLRFTSSWSDASNVDLLIVSGSLHYMDNPLPDMIAELPVRPWRLLINRTPLTEGRPVATIQDAGEFRVACMVYNRMDLLRDLLTLDYVLVDQWVAAELSLEIPGYPEHHACRYYGMFLRQRSLTNEG